MADYPSIEIGYDSRCVPDAGVEIDKAGDGTQRGRSLYAETLYSLNLVHPGITATDKDAIIAHFAAHKTAQFNCVWLSDGATYVVSYVDEPERQLVSPGRWTVTTRLTGRKV